MPLLEPNRVADFFSRGFACVGGELQERAAKIGSQNKLPRARSRHHTSTRDPTRD
jgi:hypothetical protein